MYTEFQREIYTHSAASQMAPLLQGIFAGELISPGKEIWLSSPWISDIPLLNNRANSFKHIEPLWPRGMVNLTKVLEKLLISSCQIFIITNDSRHNHSMLKWVERVQREGFDNISLRIDAELHNKGILGDNFYLMGSMNFTYNGISFLKERVEFTNSFKEVNQAKIEFRDYWASLA